MSSRSVDSPKFKELREKWRARLRADGEKFGFPVPVVDRDFSFLTEEHLIQGTITGLEYGDDELPALEVSNSSFLRRRCLKLVPYPEPPGGEGGWFLQVEVPGTAKPALTQFQGFLFFADLAPMPQPE